MDEKKHVNIFDEAGGSTLPVDTKEFVPILTDEYDDIINLPHPEPRFPRKRMSMSQRAAQFSPFSALSGYKESVWEAQRLTEDFLELTEAEKELVNMKLQNVLAYPDEAMEVAVTYFEPDEMKDGGAYKTVRGAVRKFDQNERTVIMRDGTRIPIDMLFDIKSDYMDDF